MHELGSVALHAIGDALEAVVKEFADTAYDDAIAVCDRAAAARELVDRLESYGLTITRSEPASDDPVVMVGEQRVALAVP
jgi:hypothetical protein